MSGSEHIRAALALGIAVTGPEMRRLQEATTPGPSAALLESDLWAAAAHDDLIPELRRHLASNPDRMIAAAAGLHPGSPGDLVVATLARRDVQTSLSSRLERHPSHVIGVVAIEGSSLQRRAIARWSDDVDLLDRLANDPEQVVRTTVAGNVNLSDATVTRLACDERAGVRSAVARRPSLDPAVLRLLAADEADLVRGSVGANRQTGPVELALLACDDSVRVRTAVAGNSAAPAELLASLGEDAEARVRARLGANHATPASTLAALSRDSEVSVLMRVARNPSNDPALLVTLVGRAPDAALAVNRVAPAALLESLADRSALIGSGVADPRRNERTILFDLARHPNCSTALLDRLIEFGLGDPASKASANDRLGVLRRIAFSQPLNDDIQRRLVTLDDAQLRTRLAQRVGEFAAPVDVLEILAADDRLRIGRALAANVDVPVHMREQAEARIAAAAAERRRRADRRVADRAKRTSR